MRVCGAHIVSIMGAGAAPKADSFRTTPEQMMVMQGCSRAAAVGAQGLVGDHDVMATTTVATTAAAVLLPAQQTSFRTIRGGKTSEV